MVLLENRKTTAKIESLWITKSPLQLETSVPVDRLGSTAFLYSNAVHIRCMSEEVVERSCGGEGLIGCSVSLKRFSAAKKTVIIDFFS
jgi:hypothetical protein